MEAITVLILGTMFIGSVRFAHKLNNQIIRTPDVGKSMISVLFYLSAICLPIVFLVLVGLFVTGFDGNAKLAPTDAFITTLISGIITFVMFYFIYTSVCATFTKNPKTKKYLQEWLILKVK